MIAEALRTDFEVLPEEYEATLEALIEQAGLDEDLKLAAQLAHDHSQELPYHHDGHNLGTIRRALNEAREQDLDHFSIQVLFLAASWHDADYGLPLDDADESREHRSARLAYDTIMYTCSVEKFDETRLLAARASTVILGTNSKFETTDPLAEILNMADLANLYDEDVRTMLRDTGAYFMEELMLGGIDLRSQTLSDINKHAELLAYWIGGARKHVEDLVHNKLNPNDARTQTALDHIGQLTVGRVLEVFGSRGDS